MEFLALVYVTNDSFYSTTHLYSNFIHEIVMLCMYIYVGIMQEPRRVKVYDQYIIVRTRCASMQVNIYCRL